MAREVARLVNVSSHRSQPLSGLSIEGEEQDEFEHVETEPQEVNEESPSPSQESDTSEQ